tara:strand:+ start:2761 stop:2967 length:207 start_codon:yes stop_codon:yes gene_type:complete
MKQKIFNYLMSKQWFINLVRQRFLDKEELEFNEIESEFRKYRQELDGIETISSYTYFLENNELSPFKK